ncbi:MAG: hypothetical protein MUE87_03070 [Methanothrix sp.]|nr:hypothetical protein [Methanothrix sp.]
MSVRLATKMRAGIEFLVLLAILITSTSALGDMPDSFYRAMSNVRAEETICVRNYDAGAGVIESYRDFQHLEKETEIISSSYNTSRNESDLTRGNASLEVRMNSNVIGVAHIAWLSKDIIPDNAGRHATYSRAKEDLTGVFDIEKYIQLWSNSTLGSARLNWLPCS